MKRFLLTFVVSFLVLGLMVTSITVFGDRTLFTPPPESVAEQFMRDLHEHRFSIAFQRLSAKAQSQSQESELQQLDARFRNKLGEYWVSDGKAEISGNRGQANVSLRGPDKKEEWPLFHLTFEKDQWKIEQFPR